MLEARNGKCPRPLRCPESLYLSHVQNRRAFSSEALGSRRIRATAVPEGGCIWWCELNQRTGGPKKWGAFSGKAFIRGVHGQIGISSEASSFFSFIGSQVLLMIHGCRACGWPQSFRTRRKTSFYLTTSNRNKIEECLAWASWQQSLLGLSPLCHQHWAQAWPQDQACWFISPFSWYWLHTYMCQSFL